MENQQNRNQNDESTKSTNVRPARKDFYTNMVIGSNGSVVPEEDVKGKITATDPKEVRKQMREQGWTGVRVFNREAYNQAVEDFREGTRKEREKSRENLFDEAFEGLERQSLPRVERALRTLMPLYAKTNDKKVAEAFKKIVRTVASTLPKEQTPATVH